MNKRLHCIASHIPFGEGLIDVGTDHGYLPIELISRGYPGRLYASDIKAGPLETAVRSAKEAGCAERITFQLADGLDGCDPDTIDTIVIAGMGGDTICGILDRAEFCMDSRYTLVLQPMTRAEVLRYWLVNNEFEILEEDLVEDAGILYAVLTARFGGCTRLKEAELYTGSFAMLREHRLFPAFLAQQIRRLQNMLNGLESAAVRDSSGRAAVLRCILSQLEEMRDNENT